LIILSGKIITEAEVDQYVIPSSAKTRNELQVLFDQFDQIDKLHQFIAKEYQNYKSNLLVSK
jgi:hypothetical protein